MKPPGFCSGAVRVAVVTIVRLRNVVARCTEGEIDGYVTATKNRTTNYFSVSVN